MGFNVKCNSIWIKLIINPDVKNVIAIQKCISLCCFNFSKEDMIVV